MTEPGVLFDIDGVLTVSWEPVDGAAEAYAAVVASGRPVGLVTNTSSLSRDAIVARLAEAGIDVDPGKVFTATRAAALHLQDEHAGASCLLLNEGDVASDLEGITVVAPPGPADVVLLGGAGPGLGWDALNAAFRLIDGGAPLVAMHRNGRWQTADGPSLDMGAFVAGLEEVTGTEAVIVGKPSPVFFDTVLGAIGASVEGTVMIGDDVDADVLGAQAAGLRGVLVRTGKYTEAGLARADGTPDEVIDSVADLPRILGL